MKFTFLRPKKLGYFEGKEHRIADGRNIGDYFFVEDKQEIERLKGLKEFGYQVLSFEEVSQEEQEIIEVKEEKVMQAEKSFNELEVDELRAKYLEVTGKDKVPPNKKNDIEWLKKQIKEGQK